MSDQPTSTKKKSGAFGRDLTVGSIPKHLIMFSLPMLAGSALQTGYIMVNRYWVGKLGEADIGAITVSVQLFMVLMALAMGLTMAVSILVSQYAGAHNWDRVKRVISSSTILTGIISVVLFVLGELFMRQILIAMNTPPSALPLAESYMRIMLFSLPVNFFIFLQMSALRGVGDTTTVLYFQVIFLVFTIMLDPVLMFGWLGAPKMGLNGTAVASLITQGLATITLYLYLHRKRHIVSPDWKRLRLDSSMAVMLMKIGLPTAVQQTLVAVGMIFISVFVNAFGVHALAASGSASVIDMIAFMTAFAISAAVATLTGQNIGAKQYGRVREVFWWAMLLSVGINLLITIVAVTHSSSLVGIFLDAKGNQEAIRIGSEYLHIVGYSYVFMAVMFVSNGVINGSGHTLTATFVTMLALWGVRIPMAAALSKAPEGQGVLSIPLYHHSNLIIEMPRFMYTFLHSTNGIWLSIAAGLFVGMILSLVIFFSGRWKRPVIKHGPPLPETAMGEECSVEVPPVVALDISASTE